MGPACQPKVFIKSRCYQSRMVDHMVSVDMTHCKPDQSADAVFLQLHMYSRLLITNLQ
jgi:hypothetical protein